MQIDDKVQKFKDTKAQILEYHRIANEMRLNQTKPTAGAAVNI